MNAYPLTCVSLVEECACCERSAPASSLAEDLCSTCADEVGLLVQCESCGEYRVVAQPDTTPDLHGEGICATCAEGAEILADCDEGGCAEAGRETIRIPSDGCVAAVIS